MKSVVRYTVMYYYEVPDKLDPWLDEVFTGRSEALALKIIHVKYRTM